MKTLIELYDDSPIENVLAADTFLPERIVYLCPTEIAQDKDKQQKLKEYFSHRGLETELLFFETSLFYAGKVEKQLRQVTETYPDCAIDIAGGSDAALFASGALSRERNVAVFTHSRKKKRFFEICNAPFADHLPIDVKYTVEDFFLMAYGASKAGRVENQTLERYIDRIDAFFRVFLRFRKKWNSITNWFQRASRADKNGYFTLDVSCDYTLKGERSSRIPADEEALRELEQLGFLKDLVIRRDERVSFQFEDEQIRTWLRDQGSVLEIYTWKACRDAGIFQDVHCSIIVQWERGKGEEIVSNEIDVIAVQEATPVFISCKTCPIDTDAINELAILRDRFGGDAARALLVSTENCRAITRRRADALDIDVITWQELRNCSLREQIRSLMEK